MKELPGLFVQNILFSVTVIGVISIFTYILKRYIDIMRINEKHERFLNVNRLYQPRIITFEEFKKKFNRRNWIYDTEGYFYTPGYSHIGKGEIKINGDHYILSVEDFVKAEEYLNEYLEKGDYIVTIKGIKGEIEERDFYFSL